jgi:hypothetical protein
MTSNSRMTARIRAIGGVGMLSVAMLAGTAGVAQAAVPPSPISEGNPTCESFAPAGENWTQFKLESGNLADGTYSDGTLSVTISNYVNSNSGTPGSFDWSSNIGVDAVFVKAGSDKHNLFVYAPESTGDTGLGPQAGQGNGISHISFCYDDDPETPSAPPSDETPSEEPSAPPTDEVPSEPTAPPSGEVRGVEGTPSVTLPPTDTLAASTGEGSFSALTVVVTVLLSLAIVMTVRRPARMGR